MSDTSHQHTYASLALINPTIPAFAPEEQWEEEALSSDTDETRFWRNNNLRLSLTQQRSNSTTGLGVSVTNFILYFIFIIMHLKHTKLHIRYFH